MNCFDDTFWLKTNFSKLSRLIIYSTIYSFYNFDLF